ncbi:hypothetical protein ABPG77_009285 [Micractinium sp. CCAP 211/92]
MQACWQAGTAPGRHSERPGSHRENPHAPEGRAGLHARSITPVTQQPRRPPDCRGLQADAAGDRLRASSTTACPRTPTPWPNLDQDLPNYAQHGVPIFSLPNEWLWCETWCGNETRPQAKTIDLCNNPLTKEPKLQSARRIIAEWPDLDREAAEFTAAVDRVQRGEWTEEQLMADSSAFHVRLLPWWRAALGPASGAVPQRRRKHRGRRSDATEL